jgi:hypothetical protein
VGDKRGRGGEGWEVRVGEGRRQGGKREAMRREGESEVREDEVERKSENSLIILIHTELTAKQEKKKDRKTIHWIEITHIEPEVIIENKTTEDKIRNLTSANCNTCCLVRTGGRAYEAGYKDVLQAKPSYGTDVLVYGG